MVSTTMMNNLLKEIQSKGYLILHKDDLIHDNVLKNTVSDIFSKVRLNHETLFTNIRFNNIDKKTKSNTEFENIVNSDYIQTSDNFFQIWKWADIPVNEYPYIVEYLNEIVKSIYEKDITYSYGTTKIHQTISYTLFQKGCSIVSHVDKSYLSKNRVCAILCYFSEDWEEEYGGYLVVDGKEVVLPNEGTICVLDFTKNNILHEVTKVTQNMNRFCLTAFIDIKDYE